MEVSIYRKWVSQVKKRRDGTLESQAYKMDKKALGKCKEVSKLGMLCCA